MDQPRYVYMLSTYEEDGSEEVVATLDRSRVKDLFVREQGEPPVWTFKGIERDRAEWEAEQPARRADLLQHFADARARLDELLEKTDADLAESRAGHNLGWGWGGFQLHVIVLE